MNGSNDEKVFHVRTNGDLRERFVATLERKKISQVQGFEQLAEWFLGLDDLMQSMVLGQLEWDEDIVKLMFEKRTSINRSASQGGALSREGGQVKTAVKKKRSA